MRSMVCKRSLVCLLVLVLTVSILPGTALAVTKGKVTGDYYTNNEGISFTVPREFNLVLQENKKAGFFRITLEGQRDATYHAGALAIDIIPAAKSLSAYNAAALKSDIIAYPVGWDDDELYDFHTINDSITDKFGVEAREVFMTFHIGRWGAIKNGYLYSLCFNARNSFVRMTYMCFGSQRTMSEEIEGLQEILNTLMVP